jgi:uncharacterized membrane protein YecN with MAPEG domain
MGFLITSISIPCRQIVIALRRSDRILIGDRPDVLMEESQMLTRVPSMFAGVIPAASIFAAVLRMFAAYPRETSLPSR